MPPDRGDALPPRLPQLLLRRPGPAAAAAGVTRWKLSSGRGARHDRRPRRRGGAVTGSPGALLVARRASPRLADPGLAAVGGRGRGGVRAAAESGAPARAHRLRVHERERTSRPNSVDTENARVFFDDTCEAGESEEGCHTRRRSRRFRASTRSRRADRPRRGDRPLQRAPWDARPPTAVRVGEQRRGRRAARGAARAAWKTTASSTATSPPTPARSSRAASAAAAGAGCCSSPPPCRTSAPRTWRSATSARAARAVVNNLVSLSAVPRAHALQPLRQLQLRHRTRRSARSARFCLESTSRYFNNEDTPLTHPY